MHVHTHTRIRKHTHKLVHRARSCVLVCARLCSCVLVCSRSCSCVLVCARVCSCVLVCARLCSCVLVCARSCSCVLVCAHVCSIVLVRARVSVCDSHSSFSHELLYRSDPLESFDFYMFFIAVFISGPGKYFIRALPVLIVACVAGNRHALCLSPR